MKIIIRRTLATALAAGGVLLSASAGYAQADGGLQPGLAAAFSGTAGGKAATDTAVLPNVWLHVPAGQPPTPFIDAAPFTVAWTGFVNLDLRAEYAFQAELNGSLKLEVNGEKVLEGEAGDGSTEISKLVRLNKGTNSIAVAFKGPGSGDAMLRLNWIPKGGLPAPLPSSALSHSAAAPEVQKGLQVRRGRELFLEHRCVKCHAAGSAGSAVPELALDAPSFDGIGSRRSSAWMAEWILDPKAQRPSARMPKVFHGATSKEDASAAAAYLGSLTDGAAASEPKKFGAEQQEAGSKLFAALHCAACHVTPGESGGPELVSLKQVAAKFSGGSLTAFLKKPSDHFEWIRMPNFRLSSEEADNLAAYLLANADAAAGAAPEAALIEKGKGLVQKSGCLNCHSSKLENQFAGRALADLAPAKWTEGCLLGSETPGAKAPHFAFSKEDADALRAFAASDRSSLSRHVPLEFAERQTISLNCRDCHGKFEGFPPLDVMGGKLKPEWAKAFIAGEVAEKPRPWLESRMPSFGKYAENLAHGLAAEHGHPAKTTEEPPLDAELAKIGQQLVSAEGGFSCVSCHGVAKVAATQVFESAGINLAYSSARLLKPFYTRWLVNPLAIDPTTKMPVYFEADGASPLTDVCEGKGLKQIEAIWQYIRLGDKMPPPPGTEPGAAPEAH